MNPPTNQKDKPMQTTMTATTTPYTISNQTGHTSGADIGITLYWDNQDPSNEGWAYRFNIDNQDYSGPLETLRGNPVDDNHGTARAAERAIRFELGSTWFEQTSRTINITIINK